MPPRKQPRSIARELTLLSLSQIKISSPKLADEDLSIFVLNSSENSDDGSSRYFRNSIG